MIRWLRKLLAGVRVNDGHRFEVWHHSKDRRSDAQRRRYAAIEDQRRNMIWHGTFGQPAEHDAHVREQAVQKAEEFVDNVVPFQKRAAR